MLQSCVLGLARSITVSFFIESQITSQDRHSICNVNLFVDLVSMFVIAKSAIDPRLRGDWGTPKCSLPISSRLWLVYLCVYRNIYFMFCTNDIGKNKIPPRLPPVGPRLIRGWSTIVPFPGTFILINTHMSLLLSRCSTAWVKAVFLKMLSWSLLFCVVPFWISWRCSDDNSWKQPLWTNSVDQNGSITWKALPSTCGCQGIIMNNLYYIPTSPNLCMYVVLSCICSVDVGETGWLFAHGMKTQI